jgi:RNA-splicing ligase RtcB
MSQTATKRSVLSGRIDQETAESGAFRRAHLREGLTEEISETHEKVRQAVDGLERTGVFWIVVRLRPVGVTKARQHRR